MTSDFITKRPHKKSRGGCQTCKSKRVKCDEAQPTCGFCEKRDFACVYNIKPPKQSSSSPVFSSRSPSGASTIDFATPPGTLDSNAVGVLLEPLVHAPLKAITASVGPLSSTDLRLMHHWSTSTWTTIAVGAEQNSLLLTDVPQLAFKNEYLLNCMLGIASLHQEVLDPTSTEHPKTTVGYRARALSGFREALSATDPATLDWEAALMMALLLLILCSKDRNKGVDDLTIVNWLVLYRGIAAVIHVRTYEEIFTTGLYPIFRRELSTLQTPPVIPKVLIHLLSSITTAGPSDPDFPFLEHYCKALDSLGNLYASLQSDGLTDDLYIRAITWPSFCSQEFVNCSREKRSRSLIMLAHYLVFIKLIKNIWWVDNVADVEIVAIHEMIGRDWGCYMSVPLEAVATSDKEEIARILLR